MNLEEEVLVLRDVLIPGGRVCDITLSGGRVSHLGASGKADTIYKCNDQIVLPAGIDMHVHMRDGIQAQKEDWESGTKSALAGGVTVVVDQPNTIPPITTGKILQDRAHLAEEQAYCNFAINAGVTTDADLEGMARAGAMAFGETFAGPSSYGEALTREDLESAIHTIRNLDGLVTLHAEVVQEGQDNTLASHDTLRSIAGEKQAVQMIQEIATQGSRIHFCHISCADTISTIKSKDIGTIEVTPHHLFLSHDSCTPDDTHAKVNPPLRTEHERKRLWECWNKIDVIASDHAPHTLKEKSVPFSDAPSGIPGVETMIPLLMAEVHHGRISRIDVIEKTSTNPARILGIEPAGYQPGMRADFALYPKVCTSIQAENLFSKAGWTPYEGMEGVFPDTVIMAGQVAYDQKACIKTNPTWIKGRGYIPVK